MAGSSAVRLRLRFDYPPPSGPQCRMSWILLDLNRCRVIADLCSEIRERFGYSRRAELDLFIEESYLPPTESIYLIRDNDSIRVKVSSLSYSSASEPVEQVISGKKRSRKEEDEEQLVEDCAVAVSKKSKKEVTPVNGFSHHEETKKKNKKKKRKKNKRVEPQTEAEAALKPVKEPLSSKDQSGANSRKTPGSTVTPRTSKNSRKQKDSDSSDSSVESSKKHTPKSKPQTLLKQAVTAKAKETSSSECSSSEDDSAAPPQPNKPNLAVKPSPIPLKPTSNANSKPSVKKPSTQSSSDSSPSSSSPSPPARKIPPPPPPSAVQNGPPPALSTPVAKKNEKKPESSDSDSSSETELVIKTPNPQVLGMTPRGGGRVRGRAGVRGGFGRARGTPWKQNFHYNYDSGEQQTQDDSQSNRSLILENPPEPKPSRDYSTLPLLAAPPAAGQKIAFKLLELTENYTPEVSDYKEGKIVGFNHTTGMIELEILTQTQARAEPGKFDLVYQNPDGSESVEYAVTLGSQVTERWDSLLEPRLIVESMG
ncbi:coilin [Astyanax mexicanus]|uniref:coilin n=1 Tax=Astyanax mexicanus TaxID=7994 RepID=UPI0020CB10BB|nr:coilin [Astyanax mexicanus]